MFEAPESITSQLKDNSSVVIFNSPPYDLFLGSTRVALHNSQFKIIFICLILGQLCL